METIDRIGYTQFRLEQRLDLFGISEVRFTSDDLVGVFRGFGLDDIGENE